MRPVCRLGARFGRGLKPRVDGTDLLGMAKQEIACPVCQAEMPLSGDERPGDEFHCGCCGAPGVIRTGGGDDDLEVEEDF